MKRLLQVFMKPDPRECEEVRTLFSDYVDADLDAAQRKRVEDHVGMCRRCRQVLSNLRNTLDRLGRLAAGPQPGANVDAATQRVRRTWRGRT